MPNVLIRNVSPEILESLKKRAARSGRSLQQELRLILERAARLASHDPVKAAAEINKRLREQGYFFSDSTDLIREDRDR